MESQAATDGRVVSCCQNRGARLMGPITKDAADIRSAVWAAVVAFREDLALSRFNRAVEDYEREAEIAGEWDD